jgi:hypothetical protein
MKTSKEFFKTIFQHYAFNKWIHLKIGGKLQHVGGDHYATEIETRVKNKESYFSPMLYGVAQHEPLNGFCALWVEFENFDETKAKAMDAFPLQPSIVIQNATRRVVFWVFRKPEPLTNGERFESALVRVASVLGGVVCKVTPDAAKAMLPIPNRGGWEIIELNHLQYQLSDFDSIGRVDIIVRPGEPEEPTVEPGPQVKDVKQENQSQVKPPAHKKPVKSLNVKSNLPFYTEKGRKVLSEGKDGDSYNPNENLFWDIRIPLSLARREDVSKNAKLVFGLLRLYARGKDHAFPPCSMLAYDLQIAEREVTRALQELHDKKLIKWVRGGYGRANDYSFVKNHKLFNPSAEFDAEHVLSNGDKDTSTVTRNSDGDGTVAGDANSDTGVRIEQSSNSDTGVRIEQSSNSDKGNPVITPFEPRNSDTGVRPISIKSFKKDKTPMQPFGLPPSCNGDSSESERQDMSEGEADSQAELPRCFSQLATCKVKATCAMATECEAAMDGCYGQGYSADAHCCVTCEIGMQCKMATEARGNADKC